MTTRRPLVLAAALLFALPVADASARTGASSGFSRPSSSSSSTPSRSRSSTSSSPRTSPARSGFGRTTRSGSPASSGALDNAVSRGMSKDAYDRSTTRPSAPTAGFGSSDGPATARPVPPSRDYGSRPGFAPASPPREYGNARPSANPATYGNPGIFGTGNDYASGVLSGMLLERLTRPRPSGYDEDRYRVETNDVRNRLRDIADGTSDPEERRRIEAKLNGTPAGSASSAASSAEGSGGSHALVWTLVVLALLGGVAYFAWRKGMFGLTNGRDRDDPMIPLTPRPSPEGSRPTFSPGGRVKLSSVPFVLADAAGSDVPDLSGSHSVETVGSFRLYGVPVERAYFDDGKSFVERAVDPKHPGSPQVRAYRQTDERIPGDAEDWAFFMGSDGRNGVAACDAYVGSPAVEIGEGEKKRDYDRVWGSGDGSVSPVTFEETLASPIGEATRTNAIMQYSRRLGGDGSLVEYLYMGRVEDDDGASIRVWVGLDVSADSLDVI